MGMVDCPVFDFTAEPRGKNNGNIRPNRFGTICQLLTGQFRHGEVGDNEIKHIGVFGKKFQCRFRIRHPCHPVAQPLQHGSSHPNHRDFIIHQKDDAPAGNYTTGCHPGRFLFPFGRRKLYRHQGAFSRGAFQFNGAAVALDNAVDHRQTDTRAPAHVLGGKIGFEDTVLDFRGNTGSRVTDHKADVRVDLVRTRRIFQGDSQRTARGFHGMGRIGAQVDNHLVNLGGISLYGLCIIINGNYEFHGGRQGGP